jgi:hypothetical protein
VTLGAAESCLQKCSAQLPRDGIPDDVATQADYIHVVVLDSLVR